MTELSNETYETLLGSVVCTQVALKVWLCKVVRVSELRVCPAWRGRQDKYVSV